ncbi:dihydroxyacetone kinase phosphoryl donor subunit DhaM [Actinotalea sp. Marseille-Q4924]|uniref:dihydroxyacetone kinase phosphoryl donor subunit DhaM n=1 Tax=Actinotalea sp. Marseille-Q4924 TaxID=2866571 RepID=UPI001CE3BD6D|nr:dihydroxyacetone kinase phosphoryl donor subunit DhaM [Actinotalea sp. Marseille-Q4924]
MPRVALVLVSHSRAAAEGVAEIAAQMAPDVTLLPAGGIDDGIGTDFARILEAVETATGGDVDGAVVLTDLGSAVLTTESVLEALEEDVVGSVRLADAPFLEGAVAAAVAAQQGDGLDDVLAAAERAGALFATATAGRGADEAGPGAGVPSPTDDDAAGDGRVTRTVTLRNPLGLHARPAAVVARAVADGGVPLTIDGVNGASVLELMAMGATGGQEISVAATGPGAQEAVDRVVELVESGFGEV